MSTGIRGWRLAVMATLPLAASAASTAHDAMAADDEIHPLSASAFTLTPDWSLEAHAASLQTALGTRQPASAVLKAANRRTTGCTDSEKHALPEYYNRTDYPLPPGQKLHSSESFCWDPGDGKVAYWIPQGVTGSSDANDDGLWGADRILVVSWHYDRAAAGTTAEKGVRVSFVDRATGKYQHLLLVEPTRGATPNFKAVERVHAGGLAWLGRYLYVADTTAGLRVFDMERILEVSDDKDLIGKHGDRYYAHGYRYVLPQVASYSQAAGSTLHFSSASLDRSTTPGSLVIGEYHNGRSSDPAVDGGRVVRYPVASDTRKLVLRSGKAVPTDAVTVPKSNVQGVQTWKGRYYLGRSSKNNYSFMYSGAPEAAVSTWSWAIGGEDLYHEHGPGVTAGKLWTATEHANKRVVFAVPLADID